MSTVLDTSFLKVSDGTGDAALMHITSDRAIASTVINVDAVTSVPQKFIATSGTVNASGFIDQATKTDFFGHVSGLTLVIDGFCPGNTDTGNTTGQIVIIKPNTAWADAVAGFVEGGQGFSGENVLQNGNFNNASTNGYGGVPDNWTNTSLANVVQGGFPSMTKQNIIDLLGVVDGDIEGLWNLNGDFLDKSSNGYNLTATNSPTDSSASLMSQGKTFASASTQYATNTSAPSLLMGGAQTWFAFFKPTTAPGTNMNIMGHSDSGATAYGQLCVDVNSAPIFKLTGLSTGGGGIASHVKIEAGKWYMVVGVYDPANSKLKVWVNGVKTETTGAGTHSTTGTQTFSVGRMGAYNSEYLNGTVQASGVLSVALSDDQVKRLFAATSFKGVKCGRTGTDGYISNPFDQRQLEYFRGRTVTIAGKYWQDTPSIAYISGTDGATLSTASTSTTTGSWIDFSLSLPIAATATSFSVRLGTKTSNGNVWFKEVGLYEGTTAFPFKHSPLDWSRFPSLLKMSPPPALSGYQYEEGRIFSMVPSVTGVTAQPDFTTYFCFSNGSVLVDNQCGAFAVSNSTAKTITLPAIALKGSYAVITQYSDNGSTGSTTGQVVTASNSNVASLYKDAAGAGWTGSGNWFAKFMFSYQYYQ